MVNKQKSDNRIFEVFSCHASLNQCLINFSEKEKSSVNLCNTYSGVTGKNNVDFVLVILLTSTVIGILHQDLQK